MPDLAGIQATGATLRGQVAVARAQLNTIDAKLAAAARIGADDAVALDSQTQQLKRDRVAAGAQRDAAVGELHDTIGDLISQLDPASALGALESTLPVAVLPVRLETRFNPDKPTELLVRILPDDIHGHSHEPECTADEMVAGKRYWETVWSSPTTEPDATLADRAAWSDLAARVGLNRAAWLVRVLTPAHLGTRPRGTPTFPEVALKDQAWTRAAWTTTMPDRLVVMAYRAVARIATAWADAVRSRYNRCNSLERKKRATVARTLSLFRYFFGAGVSGIIFAASNNASPTNTLYTGQLLGCNAIGCMLLHSPNAAVTKNDADIM